MYAEELGLTTGLPGTRSVSICTTCREEEGRGGEEEGRGREEEGRGGENLGDQNDN